MRLADRMTSIGMETAFEAAARARALGATGRSGIHLARTVFGMIRTHHIRRSEANALEHLAEALRRMRTVVEPLVTAGAGAVSAR